MRKILHFKWLLIVALTLVSSSLMAGSPLGKVESARYDHYSTEGSKFQVLPDIADPTRGTIRIQCESAGCTPLEGKYDTQTKLYLPGNTEGDIGYLSTYSGRNADISIRKSDMHVRRIRVYR